MNEALLAAIRRDSDEGESGATAPPPSPPSVENCNGDIRPPTPPPLPPRKFALQPPPLPDVSDERSKIDKMHAFARPNDVDGDRVARRLREIHRDFGREPTRLMRKVARRFGSPENPVVFFRQEFDGIKLDYTNACVHLMECTLRQVDEWGKTQQMTKTDCTLNGVRPSSFVVGEVPTLEQLGTRANPFVVFNQWFVRTHFDLGDVFVRFIGCTFEDCTFFGGFCTQWEASHFYESVSRRAIVTPRSTVVALVMDSHEKVYQVMFRLVPAKQTRSQRVAAHARRISQNLTSVYG